MIQGLFPGKSNYSLKKQQAQQIFSIFLCFFVHYRYSDIIENGCNTSNIQRFKVNVQRFKVNVQLFKVTHAAQEQNLSTSVHFHQLIGISINYRRGENSMIVEILNQNNSKHLLIIFLF